ncbi:sensor histidine kinase [Monashia sp. NPDC004114]
MSSDQAVVSARVAEAQQRAEARLRHDRDLLRPLGWALIAVVVAGAATQQPSPGLGATGVAVTLFTAGYAASTATVIGNRFPTRPAWVQVAVVVTMAVCGVALSWLQPRGVTGLAAGAAAWMAIARLQPSTGAAVAVATGAGGAVAATRSGSPAAVVATVLLTALMGLIAYMLRQGRDANARTEVLLAQLADARDAEARAAVVAERGRIAAELHDVLAHALSGAALQLQGARLLAEREGVSAPLDDAIARAARLVADGLVNAKQAVQALRGAGISSVAQLERLVEDCRRDFRLDVTLHVRGAPHVLAPEPALALYRGVEEALTNAARHAPGAVTDVSLTYLPDRTDVQVDTVAQSPDLRVRDPGPFDLAAPAGHGGGNGLAGMRERVERLGGTMDAGPVDGGWRVVLAVPNSEEDP